MNLARAVEIAQSRFEYIYLIWWNQNIGWYPNQNFQKDSNLPVPSMEE